VTVNNCDDKLLQQARNFDRAALTAVYDHYHPLLYRYISRQVSDAETARELTAAVFERFLAAIKNGNSPETQLKAWLYRTAHNLVIDHYRRQAHRNHLPLADTLPSDGTTPGQLAEQHLLGEQVITALQTLTPEQQQVITLKFLEGFSNAEVAALMKKPVGAVKSLQHRGLARLQQILAPQPSQPIEERVA
jgi:RNA polymerase sigma-70 factor (ECF subfamily)